MLLNTAVEKKALYGVLPKGKFWNEVASTLKAHLGRGYSGSAAQRRVEGLVRDAKDENPEETGTERGDDDWHQALGQWMEVTDAEEERLQAAKESRREAENQEEDVRTTRENLTRLAGQKRGRQEGEEVSDGEGSEAEGAAGPSNNQPTSKRSRKGPQAPSVDESFARIAEVVVMNNQAPPAADATERTDARLNELGERMDEKIQGVKDELNRTLEDKFGQMFTMLQHAMRQ